MSSVPIGTLASGSVPQRPPLPVPLPPERLHRLTLTVGPGDLDEYQHVNNVQYLNWLEDVARAHAARVGADTDMLRQAGVLPVVREHHLRYLKPAFLGELLTIETVITASRGFRSTRHNTVLRGDELLVEGRTEWIWVDAVKGRPKPPPAEVLERFGWGEDKPAE